MSTKLFDLPIGSWFRYKGDESVRTFIFIDLADCGLICDAPPIELQGQRWSGQRFYSAAESRDEFREMLVEFVPVRPHLDGS